jgi:nicotinamidase-related amidase
MMKDKARLSPGSAALVVVDVQERLAAVMPLRERVVRNIGILVRAAKLLSMPVLVTQQYT